MSRITLPPDGSVTRLNEVRELARDLMDEHGLEDWALTFGRAKFQAGICLRDRKEIKLSAPLMSIWELEHSRDTILHEIAHALTTGSHGPAWKARCRQIGADPSRTWGHKGEAQIERKPSKYVGVCPNGHETPRSRMPRAGSRYSCYTCSPSFSADYLITWKVRNGPR
jgi:predicted SprT family Zn-dependent metalloprotease